MLRLWILIVLSSLCCGSIIASQCTFYGRFPNDDVPECRGYIMCIDRGGGVFTQYNLTCPPGFVFNPVEHVCTNVTTYNCLDRPLQYNCPGKGFYKNELSNDCTSYIACIESISGSITPKLFDCPPATLFFPLAKNCIDDTEYQCPINTAEAPTLINASEVPSVLGSNDADIDNVKGSAINLSFNHFVCICMILVVFLGK